MDGRNQAERRRARRIREKRRRIRRRRRIRLVINLVFIGIFLISVFSYTSSVWKKRKAQQEFEKLALLTEQSDNTDIQAEDDSAVNYNDNTDDESQHILSKYQDLYKQNTDMKGWIKIEDTVVNYPVMFTPQDVEYYLKRSFAKEDSPSGTPFIGYDCTLEPRSSNIIIYGHNMSDGSMFNTLLSYSDMEFWQEHPVIEFDTLYETGYYEIMSVFYVNVTEGNGHFPFYEFITAKSDEEYQNYVETCKELSLYDTGVIPETGTDLVTLVTCSETRSNSNGRIVVVGCKIK